MAEVFIGSIRGRGAWGLFCRLLLWCLCCSTYCDAASNDTFVPYDDFCTRNFTLRPTDPPEPLPAGLLLPQLARDRNRTRLTFEVKACSDAQVILYGIDLKPPPAQPTAGVVKIVLGLNNQSRSLIMSCESASSASSASSPSSSSGCQESWVLENPLDCEAFRTFGISWEEKGGVKLFKQVLENGTHEWQVLLQFHSTVRLQGVFGAYRLGADAAAADADGASAADGGDGAASQAEEGGKAAVSEWRFHVPCTEDDKQTDGPCIEGPADTSSMVSRGHLAGAVIATLLAGIIIGAMCVIYVPKLVVYIRRALAQRRQKNRGEVAGTQEELSSLVAVPFSPDKKQQQAPAAGTTVGTTETPGTKVDLALPGDNPPPPPSAPSTTTTTTQVPAGSRRKAGNTYTPYHEMGGGTAAAAAAAATVGKSESAPAKKADKTTPKSGPRKESKAGRTVTSPLPALPGDDVTSASASASAAESTAAQDEVYVNADTHIYEGMQLDAPIYENRNTSVYEALQPESEHK